MRRHRGIRRRLDKLDDGGGVQPGSISVNLEITNCKTQEEYDRAFERAWDQVPIGAVVYVFRDFSDKEFEEAVDRYNNGLPPVIDERFGLYFKRPS